MIEVRQRRRERWIRRR